MPRKADAPDGDAAPEVQGFPLTCRPATPEEVGPALRLVLSTSGRLADQSQVVDFMTFALRRGINLNDVWLAERRGRIGWAVLPIVSPGRTMLLLAPPDAPPAGPGTTAAQLVEAVCRHFPTRSVQLAQVLLDPPDASSQEFFAHCGFSRIAELIYLQGAPRRRTPAPPLPPGFAWRSYEGDTHALFAAAIAESYRGSLDCPALNGLRDVEDILAGHKGSGEFDPRLWTLLCENGVPVGMVLLSRVHPGDGMEVVYLGLVPAARGRGLSDLLMRHALHCVATSGSVRLSLAVDAKNAPALKLYYRHGMQRVGSKVAMMRDLRVRRAASVST